MVSQEIDGVCNKQAKYSLDIQNLSKVFSKKTLQKGGYTTLKSLLLNPLKHETSSPDSYFYAINNLTLQIPRGKSVGIIGRNGAGKSTLLKLISGIYQPTSGAVKVNGKIAALIELGAGFHPDFTGRENIYLGGAMHGMTREEIDSVYDDIVKFSELEDFIDAPIRTYSSGMFMRLGFSLAIHTSPDILIVDEVLAVGDASFNAKCKDKLFDIRKNGTTLLLVSHDLNSIREWCDEAVWIEKGSVKSRGVPDKVIEEYLDYVNIRDGERLNNKSKSDNKKQDEHIAKNLLNSDLNSNKDDKPINFVNFSCLDANQNECYAYKTNDKLTIKIDYEVSDAVTKKIVNPVLEICIKRSDGMLVNESNTKLENVKVVLNKKKGSIKYFIKDLNLLPAKYAVSIIIKNEDGYLLAFNNNAVNFLVRSECVKSNALYLLHEWSFS